MRQNALDVLNVTMNVINNICGNLAGGALLANVLHENRYLGGHEMKVTLEKCLQEISDKTTVNNQYPVLTSSKSGLFLQSDYFNKQVASKDNSGYKIIRKGQFTYRAMSDTGEFFPNMLECADIGIVSPAYPVFEITKPEIILPEYLKFFFKSNSFQHAIATFAQGSTRTSIKFGKMKTISIELPPITEQEIIIAILNKALLIVSARQTQIQKLDDLVKARFVEMFGEPRTNPNGYELEELRSSCSVITGNTPPRSIAGYYGDYIEWIKTDNIVSKRTNPTHAAEYLSEEGMKVGRLVDKDAILMACIAGSIASIGRVCITDRKVAFNQQINAVIPKHYDVRFLYVMLQISKNYLVEEINMALKGILSKSKLEDKVFYVPPMELQQQFAAFVAQVDKSKLIEKKGVKNEL